MSTDLYRIRVTKLDRPARTVSFRVFLVYYDWTGVPTDPSFFMRILWDQADTRFGGGGPLGNEVTLDQFLDEKWIDENTHRFVERVTRRALRNDPLPAGKTPPTFIYESFKNEDILTQGDFDVVVSDPRWIEHLKVGQTWQTTSYGTQAKMPAGRDTVLADDVKQAPGKKPKAKAKAKAKPKTKAKAKPKTKAKAKPKTKPKAKPKTKANAKPKTKAKAKAAKRRR